MRSIVSLKTVAGLGMAAALVASPAVAHADEVFFAGSTQGAFNGTPVAASSTLLGLTYNNSSFAGTTSAGFLGIGAAANPAANFNNLGSFTLDAVPHVYGGNTFQLMITFTAPAGIAGGQSTTFSSVLTGSVTSANNGGVLVDFDNAPRTFTFNNGTSSGTFVLSVNDVAINAGKKVEVTGQILSATSTTVPEPASMTLLATGLAGLGAAARRRKQGK